MPLDELVAVVNGYGTLPRQMDGRAPSRQDPDLVALADEVHPIFAVPDAQARAAMVTDLLDRTGVRPVLATAESGQLAELWQVDDAAQAHRAAAALGLRAQLADRQGRIGVCADPQCADVYVDASPTGRRRFCCLTCQNRARAAAFRRRHAAG
jgi:predicted RNA-binding Zn ribbon-like protein